MHSLRFRYLLFLHCCLLAALGLSGPLRAQEPPAATTVPAKPTLYVLAIGVSQYLDATNTLMFPAKDATDVAAQFRAQEGKLFGKVVVTTLTDRKASRDGIIQSLVALRKQVPQMGPNDYVLLFAAGHGTNDDLGQYFFAPYNVDADNIDSTAVDWVLFSRTLAALPCHVLLMLDTCHAAGALAPPNAAVFAACGKGELSQESREWDAEAFSKALLEGLGGKADGNHDGVVTLTELADYTTRRVAGLTKQAQNPALLKSAAFPADLPLALVGPTH